jgi:hypothetical protein
VDGAGRSLPGNAPVDGAGGLKGGTRLWVEGVSTVGDAEGTRLWMEVPSTRRWKRSCGSGSERTGFGELVQLPSSGLAGDEGRRWKGNSLIAEEYTARGLVGRGSNSTASARESRFHATPCLPWYTTPHLQPCKRRP